MLNVTFGVMGSGKSKDLIETYHRLKHLEKKICVVKSSRIVKKSKIYSRAGKFLKCNTIFLSTDTKFADCVYNADIIFIDEVQFASLELVNEIKKLSKTKDVFCYGLRNNHEGNSFNYFGELLCSADAIKEIDATCACGQPAIFNQRLSPAGEVVTKTTNEDDQVKFTYLPVCSQCFVW